jgi:hypothetical protein
MELKTCGPNVDLKNPEITINDNRERAMMKD